MECLVVWDVAFGLSKYFSRKINVLNVSDSCFAVAPVNDCTVLMQVICVVFHITISSTALLFLLHVCAIFIQNRYITIIFFMLWVGVVGQLLSTVLSTSGEHISTTNYYALSNLNALCSATTNIIISVFDTCVFIAIT
ncbi:hypothetical protein BDZ94DRAFT_1167210 [Collybia nuda]|uniref:Uncharacterized protein n=1 Tax=Collybia nuda TaxID=64659 RepID=A0A9P6CDH6_9AGAR|nr:hypothetical protein BDZ94DRAFT_1167210 [Collybia nuda]